MPQVASPANKVHAHSHAQQARAARSAPADRDGTPSLFDSLVDQSATGPQADAQSPAQPAGQKAPAGQTSKADAAKGEPVAQNDNPAPTGAVIDIKAAEDTATPPQTIPVATPDAAKPDAPRDEAAAKDSAKDAADPLQPVTVDPALIADPAVAAAAAAAAVTPPATPAAGQSAPGGEDAAAATTAAPAGPAVATASPTAPAQTEPAEPAFVAAATAQKLQPFDGKDGSKDKPQADKPSAAGTKAAAAAPASPQPTPADDQAVPPQPQPGSRDAAVADTKPAPDKPAAKDAPNNHDRIDATATARLDAPAAPDGSAIAGTQGASAATGTASAHGVNPAGPNAAAQTAANPQQAPTVPIAGLAVEIAGRAHAGKNNFEIRLDPPELGRIEVKLSVDRQGQVTSHLIADRQDTLDLLRRDSSGLERALQDAGLKTGGDGLQFSLRDQSFNGGQNGDNRSNASQVVATDDTLPTIDAAAGGYTRYAGRIGGIDIRV